ncbi:MAG: hypothetical protein ACTMIY_12000 [Microbacterium gubbeenense]
MMVELAQPVTLVARWPMHGDLRVVVDGTYTYLRATDVEQLAEIPAWGEGETVIGDEWPDELNGEAYYLVDQALAKLRRHLDEEAASGFVAWLDEALPDLIAPETVAAARKPTSFTRGVTVQQAARQLAGAGIRLGRTGLFHTMHELGWTRREGDSWALTSLPLDREWAAVRQIRHPNPGKGRAASYDQIYILPAGLDELVTQLAAPDQSIPTVAAQAACLPLFDPSDSVKD